MGFRYRMKRLMKAAEKDLVAVRMRDGTTAKFPGYVGLDALAHEWTRGQRRLAGEDPGPAHPFVVALRGADDAELRRLASEEGTVVLMMLGEDEVIRGSEAGERPGSPVRETEE